jgi:hypothetical protein
VGSEGEWEGQVRLVGRVSKTSLKGWEDFADRHGPGEVSPLLEAFGQDLGDKARLRWSRLPLVYREVVERAKGVKTRRRSRRRAGIGLAVLAVAAGAAAYGLTLGGSPPPTSQVTAAQVVAELRRAGVPLRDVQIQGPTRASFDDARLTSATVQAFPTDTLPRGGLIEVYQRSGVAHSNAVDHDPGDEYDFADGLVLVRLSPYLTMGQALSYGRAIGVPRPVPGTNLPTPPPSTPVRATLRR